MDFGRSNIKRKIPSLQLRLIIIILLCWVLPILMFIGVTGYFISNNINKQMENTITTSVSNAVKICKNRIDSAISASHNASYIPSIRNAYTDYLDNGDENELYEAVTNFLSQQYKYDDKFLTTILYFCNSPYNIYYTYNNGVNSTYSIVRKYRDSVHEKVQKISGDLDTEIAFINVDGNIYMVRNILDQNFRPFAVIIMELNTSVMFDSIKNVVWETATTLYLGDTPIVIKGDPLNAHDMGIEFLKNTTRYIADGGQTIVCGMDAEANYNLSYIVSVDSSELMNELFGFLRILLFVLLLTLPLLGLVIRFFYHNVSHPIKSLVQAADEIKEGRFGIQVKGHFNNREFKYLSDNFNSMSNKLKNQFEKIFKEELALRDARIMALQSQINPHFLNNTLEIINWEARMADNVKVSHMIEALSTMMDAATDREREPMIHLSKEMMYVDAYLYIISVRLGRRLVIRKEIDESLLDFVVPRLIVQPIIENAVEHGIEPLQKGTIFIRIYRDNDNLLLEIENDGELTLEDEKKIALLLSPGYESKNESSYNLGIRNVNQRLKIIYGEKSGLTIRKGTNQTTLSKITISIGQT